MRWKLPGCSMLSPVLLVSALEARLKLSSAWRFTFILLIMSKETWERSFYQVTEKDKKGQGGGVAEEGEFIDVVEMGVEEVRMLQHLGQSLISNIQVKSYLGQERVNSPAGFLFAVQWFLLNKMPS